MGIKRQITICKGVFVKKYLREIIISLLQMFVFLLLPKILGNIGALGMVFLLFIITFILSIIFGIISKNKIKYVYPIFTALTFIPTIWIYYNESALIHSLWYLVISSVGLVIGIIANKLFIIKK